MTTPPSSRNLRLNLFGSAELTDASGTSLDAILTGPKRIALLAYLVLGHRGGLARRDTILPLFWPEATAERARQALRSLLYILRTELGDGVIITRGDEVGVDLDALSCDAVEFDEAVRADDLERAATLYRGDLLNGLFVDAAPDFERWLEDRRALLRRDAQGALWSLADQCARSGERPLAERHARTAAALAPNDEHSLRRLMLVLAALGDASAALDAYQSFSTTLAAEYDASPTEETRSLADRIRRADADVVSATPHPRVASRGSPLALLRQSIKVVIPERMVSMRTFIAACVAVAGVTFAVSRFSDLLPFELRAAEPGETIAVLPFNVPGGSDLALLGDGMVELISDLLPTGAAPRTIDPRLVLSVFHESAGRSVHDIAGKLGARRVITGSVFGSGTGVGAHIVVTATLADAADGHVIARANAAGARDSLSVLAQQITARLLLETLPTGSHLGGHWTGTPSFDAVRALLEGRAAYRRGSYESARDAYERALSIDSGFVLAAFGLAELAGYIPFDAHNAIPRGQQLAWKSISMLPERDRSYLQAIVGPRYPSPSTPLELLSARERAVMFSPDRADAWYLLGDHLLRQGGLLGDSATTRTSEALLRALTLDSMYAAPMEDLMELAFLRGDQREGISLARRYVELHSASEAVDYVRWRLAFESGDASALARERGLFPRYNRLSLERVTAALQSPHPSPPDAMAAARALESTSITKHDRVAALYAERQVALTTGHLREARAVTLSIVNDAATPAARQDALINILLDDLSFGTDTPLGDSVRHEFEALTPNERRAMDTGTRWPIRNVCLAARWDAVHGRTDDARRGIEELRTRAADATTRGVSERVRRERVEVASMCRVLLEAELAVRQDPRSPTVRLLLADANAAARANPILHTWAYLWAVHLNEASGNVAAARRISRARGYMDGMVLLDHYEDYLHAEARLDATMHDCAGARAALRQLVAVQAGAEPAAVARNRTLGASLTGRCGADVAPAR